MKIDFKIAISLISVTIFIAIFNTISADQSINKSKNEKLDASNFSLSSMDLKCMDCPSTDNCTPCAEPKTRTSVRLRNPGDNTARQLVGWQWDIYRYPFSPDGQPAKYGAVYLAYEYQHSFDGENLANALFGGTTLRFSGSLSPNRRSDELLADNFGLSRTFKGRVDFCPTVENNIIDFGYFMSFNCWCPGAYLRLHAPVVISKWNLGACEVIENEGSDEFEDCYVLSDTKGNTKTAKSLQQALNGHYLFGDMKKPWCSGRFDFCGKKNTGLADIDLMLGYNWFPTPNEHFGIFLRAVFPTGRKPETLYVFDPVIGNGGFFELGAGLTGHKVFWETETQKLAIFFEGNVTHLFETTQCRLFDLCNGDFTRYALLKSFDSDGIVNSYNGDLISSTCFAIKRAKVKLDVKGDISIKLAYQWCNIGFDLGYNLYGHDHETIKMICDDECRPDLRRLAIKGTAPVCCDSYPIACVPNSSDFEQRVYPNGTAPQDLPESSVQCLNGKCDVNNPEFGSDLNVKTIRSNITQPSATAYHGAPALTSNTQPTNSCTVNLEPNSKQITDPDGQLVATLSENGFIICNNTNPINFLDSSSLNLKSAETLSTLTHKIFTHISYNWPKTSCYNAQLGVGGEVEFSANRTNSATCKKTDLNQWGIWVKGVLFF